MGMLESAGNDSSLTSPKCREPSRHVRCSVLKHKLTGEQTIQVVHQPTTVLKRMHNDTKVVHQVTNLLKGMHNDTKVVHQVTNLLKGMHNDTKVVHQVTNLLKGMHNDTKVVHQVTNLLKGMHNDTKVVHQVHDCVKRNAQQFIALVAIEISIYCSCCHTEISIYVVRLACFVSFVFSKILSKI